MSKKLSSDFYNDALLFFEKKQYSRALTALKRTLILEPSLLKAHILKLQILYLNGDWEALYDAANLALSYDPNQINFLEKSAIANEKLGKTIEAQEFRQKLEMNIHSAVPDIRKEVINVLNTGQFNVFIEYLYSSVREDSQPTDKKAFVNLLIQICFACLSEGREDEALSVLLKAEQIEPNDPLVLGQIHSLFKKQGNDAEAESYLQKISDIPEDKLKNRESDLLEVFKAMLQADKFEEYLETLDKILAKGSVEDTKSAVSNFQLIARLCLNEGRVEESMKCIQRAHALDEHNSETLLLWGECLLKSSPFDPFAAKAKFEEAAELGVSTESSSFNIAFDFANVDEHEKAISLYLDFLTKYPESTQAIAVKNNLGLSYERLGNWEKSITYYEEALTLDPQYEISTYNLGIAYKGKGENNLAVTTFKKLSDSKDYSLVAAEQLYELASYENAIEAFNKILIGEHLNVEKGKANLRIGQSLRLLGRKSEAIQALEEAKNISISGEDWKSLFEIAYTLADRGLEEHLAAIKLYEICIEKSSADENLIDRAWNNIGVSRESLGDPMGAIDAYSESLRINPHYRQPYKNQSVLFSQTYEKEKELRCHQKWLLSNSSDNDAKLEIASIYAWYLNNVNEAELYYNKVFSTFGSNSIQDFGQYINPLDDYINFLRYHRRYDRAMELLDKVERELPHESYFMAIVHYKKGTIHFERHDFDAAKTRYQQALKIMTVNEPIFGFINHDLAYCLDREASYEKAMEQWVKTIKIYSSIEDETGDSRSKPISELKVIDRSGLSEQNQDGTNEAVMNLTTSLSDAKNVLQ